MELLLLIPVLAFVTVFVAFKEWLNLAHKRWLTELDLFKRRLAAYEQLKTAVAPLRAKRAVSRNDADRFARAMADMRFLFDKDLELFVGGIYGTLLKKQELDALLAKAAACASSPSDKALTEMAQRKSRELASQITDGIYRDVPKRMEKFMHPRPIL
jgi:hypothetical protein